MDRSSWKTAHEDAHPEIQYEEDLQSHLLNHHHGDYIEDMHDHDWLHSDPEGYNRYNEAAGHPVTNQAPDHYHTDEFGKIYIPNELPANFASIRKIADPTSNLRGEGASAFTEPTYQDDQPDSEQVVGPQDLDSNATNVDKFPESVGVFKNSSWKFATSACPGCPFTEQIEELSNRIGDSLEKRDSAQTLEGYHTFREEGRRDISRLAITHRNAADFHLNIGNEHHQQMAANHLEAATRLRKEYISSHPFDASKERDLRRESRKKVGSKLSSWNKRFADSAGGGQFGNPIDDNGNRMQSVESPGLGVSYPLDTGQRNYSEQYQDANPLSLRSWFTGQDLNGPWPHTKHLTGPLDFEPTDHTNDNSTGPVTSSWHQSFVETFDTHPEEPSPDTLLNPSDELKNGRPRSTDLPTQGAQFIPGMLAEHDPMGGSNFGGSSA